MSGYTTTPNYGLRKPTVNGDDDQWGYDLNTDMDTLDTVIKTVENKAGVVSFNTRTGPISLTSGDVTTVLPPSNANPLAAGVAAPGTSTAWARGDHVHPGLPGGATPGVSPPASPAPGALWWDSNAGVLYVRYDDGTSAQWVPATPAAAVRSNARLQAQWVSGAVVANDTVYMAFDVPYAGTVNSLTYFTGVGSFSVAIQINGTNVGGLSAIAVSSATPSTANASGANTFTAGQRITAVITGSTTAPAPTDALLSLAVTWA